MSTPPPPTVSFQFRNIKSLNRDEFMDCLQSASFICNPHDDVDLFYNQISSDVTCILDDLIPMTVVTKRKPTCNKSVLSLEALAAKRSSRFATLC